MASPPRSFPLGLVPFWDGLVTFVPCPHHILLVTGSATCKLYLEDARRCPESADCAKFFDMKTLPVSLMGSILWRPFPKRN